MSDILSCFNVNVLINQIQLRIFADIAGGYLCFVVPIFAIGVVTAIIGDVASHFGCTLGIKDSVTAIVFVALGTSIPGKKSYDLIRNREIPNSVWCADTFASKVAAIQDKYADASVGNVTGSNAVNVFLGIGVAWTIAAIYHAYHGREFLVEPGKWVTSQFISQIIKLTLILVPLSSLAFSVTLFCSEAVVAILVLMLRRNRKVGGVLGGPAGIKYLTTATLVGLWLIYLIMSSLEAYGYIKGF